MRPLGKAVDGRAWPGVARVGLTLARVGLHLSLERVEWLGGERRDQSERHAADRAVNELESGRSLAHGAARCGRHRCTGRGNDIAAANTAREGRFTVGDLLVICRPPFFGSERGTTQAPREGKICGFFWPQKCQIRAQISDTFDPNHLIRTLSRTYNIHCIPKSQHTQEEP